MMGRSDELGSEPFLIRAPQARSDNCGRIISIINNCLAFVIAPVDSVDNRPFCSSAAFGPVDEQWTNHKDPWANRGRTGGRPQVVIRSCTDHVKHSTVHPQVLGGLSTGCPRAFGGPGALRRPWNQSWRPVRRRQRTPKLFLRNVFRPTNDRQPGLDRPLRGLSPGADRAPGRLPDDPWTPTVGEPERSKLFTEGSETRLVDVRGRPEGVLQRPLWTSVSRPDPVGGRRRGDLDVTRGGRRPGLSTVRTTVGTGGRAAVVRGA